MCYRTQMPNARFVFLVFLVSNGFFGAYSHDKILVGSSCTLHTDCNNALEDNVLLNSKCSDSECTCVNGYHGNKGSKICQKVRLGIECSHSSGGLGGVLDSMCQQFVPNSECHKGTGVCACVKGAFRKLTPAGLEYCQCAPGSTHDGRAEKCGVASNEAHGADGSSRRKQDNAICDDEECLCKTGYVAYPPLHSTDVSLICAQTIDSSIDPNCFWCDSNNGTCVDLDGDYLRDECICPQTKRSSDSSLQHPKYDCDTSLLEVNCITGSMIACYSPPKRTAWSKVRFQNRRDREIYKVTVEGRSETPKCAFSQKADGTFCNKLRIRLTMLDVCGIRREKDSDEYSASILVQSPDYGDQYSADTFTFKAFCKYNWTEKTASGRAEIISYETNTRHKSGLQRDEFHPALRLSVRDKQDKEISIINNPGDLRVKLVVELLNFKDIYTSITVDECVAAASLSAENNDSILLISNGCAAPGISGFNHNDDDKRGMKTKLFSLPNLGNFEMLFIHCAVRVCRQKGGCIPSDCDKRRRSDSKTILNSMTASSFDWGVLSGIASPGIRVRPPLPGATPYSGLQIRPMTLGTTPNPLLKIRPPLAGITPNTNPLNIRKGEKNILHPMDKDRINEKAEVDYKENVSPDQDAAETNKIVDGQPTDQEDYKEEACHGLFGSCHFEELHLILTAVGTIGFFVLLAILTYFLYRRKVDSLKDELQDMTCALNLSSNISTAPNGTFTSGTIASGTLSRGPRTFWSENSSYI